MNNASAPQTLEVSPHHEAVLSVESEASRIGTLVDTLAARLMPVSRPDNEGSPNKATSRPSSNVPVIAHVEHIQSQLASYVASLEDIINRLAI